MNLRFIHDNLYPLFAALAFIAAVVCWFGTAVPAQPPAPLPVAETWRVPRVAVNNSKKSIDTISARNLWGSVLADAPKAPEWHVLGIATNGADRFVLLAFEGKPVASLKVGDALPDDTKIVQIEKNRFFVRTPDNKTLAFGFPKYEQVK